MKILYLIIWLLVVNAFQGVLGVFISDKLTIDLTLIAVVIYSIHYKEEAGTVIGFFFGLFQDGLSGGVFGINTICKTIVGFFVGKISGRLILESFITHFLVVFCSSILEGIIAFLVVVIFEIMPIPKLSGNLLPSAFFNGILGVVIFQIIRLIRSRFSKEAMLPRKYYD